MRFGKLLYEERAPRKLLLQTLAALCGYSIATLSQIERGVLLPTDEAADKIMSSLGLDEEARKRFRLALKKDRADAKKKEAKPKSAFGVALRDLLKELNITSSKLNEHLGRPVSTVNAWVSGSLLPGSNTVADELIPALRSLGADDSKLQALKLVYLRDQLPHLLRFEFLDEEIRASMVSAAYEAAKMELLPSNGEDK